MKYIRIIECVICGGNVDRANIDKARFVELKLAYEEQRRSGFWREWTYFDTQFCSFKTGAHCDGCHTMLEYERANA